MSRVSDLLRDSMAAHQNAKPQGRGGKITRPRNREELQKAHDLRVQAHELDPDHTDQAWADEQVKTPTGSDTHKELMDFYRVQLG